MKFMIHATITHEVDGWTGTRQVPFFIIDGDTCGIVTNGTETPEEQAERVARRIIDPFGDHLVHATAYHIEGDDDIVIDLDVRSAVHENLVRP